MRATGSGAGCGSSWPHCEGSILPLGGASETAIEFSHRAMTAALAVVLVALAVRVLRETRRGDPVRSALGWAAAFFVGEIVIGAVLVLFGWVDDDASAGRFVMVGAHLVNTFLLLGALTLTAHLASGGAVPRFRPRRSRDRLVVAGTFVLLVVAVSGGLNALADTLYPAGTFLDGLSDEFGPAAPVPVRLRVLHPALAVVGGIVAIRVVRHPDFDPGRTARGPAAVVVGTVVLQFGIGLANVVMATPVEIQVLHLLGADVIWIAFVLASTRVLGRTTPVSSPVPARETLP